MEIQKGQVDMKTVDISVWHEIKRESIARSLLFLFRTYTSAIVPQQHGTTQWTSGQGDKITFYVFFNRQYMSNYLTNPVKTKSIRKIKSQLYIHIVNFLTIYERKQL